MLQPFSPSPPSPLSVAPSYLQAFRTNTAYERFNEARRMWGVMHLAIRNMSRLIWIHAKEPEAADLIEKRTVINLLAAYAVAVKYHLRCKYGSDHVDLKQLLGDFPVYVGPLKEIEVQSTHNKMFKKKVPRLATELAQNDQATPDNIPLRIASYLSAYINYQNKKAFIDVPTTNGMMTAVNSLVECLTTFERILRTPIPAAYAIQLSQTVWIYIIALPFQLVSTFHWITVVVVAITAFILLGFESIGQEIENPFGYDSNDLPLDLFCQVIIFELNQLTSTPPPSAVQDWIFSAKNKPFCHTGATAEQLKEQTVEELRSMFLEELISPKPRSAISHEDHFTVVALGESTITMKEEIPTSKSESSEEIEPRH
ncbi:Bestrophin, RFP-TM, chloride channel-domain-containing protein [Endogone sp. FLAS-F59071]|nr:Bestrophin, RFP-TM, chloride channel-domain-containing protein [Endogone sp. FLAS-F59071]|eukprot:RUS14176.1 Bestrophin, RFP-TM, chloride channel-domain-containing protein [Endogone sp. FLAS-F59071]